MAGVALLWGSIGVLVRWIDLPAVSVVFARVVIGAAGLAAWLRIRRATAGGARVGAGRPVDERSGVLSARTVVSGTLLAAHWVALFAAMDRAPIGTVLLITYLAPVMVAVAAPRVLGERATMVVSLALAGAVAGSALVVGPGASDVAWTGLGLAGFAAVSYAVLTLTAKPLAATHGGVQLALVQQSVAAVVLLPFALAVDWGTPELDWGWLLVLGLVHTAAGIGLFLSALARLPVTSFGVLTYLEPVSAVLFGWVVLAETPGPATVVGGALILAAGAVVARAGARGTDVIVLAGARG